MMKDSEPHFATTVEDSPEPYKSFSPTRIASKFEPLTNQGRTSKNKLKLAPFMFDPLGTLEM